MFNTIIGEEDREAVLLWMRGRISCSFDEWNWCQFILHPIEEDDSELPF